jgi:hypothetical protein
LIRPGVSTTLTKAGRIAVTPKPLAVLALCLAAPAAIAQHSFSRTLTVDPSGNADYTTIQAAVNAIVSALPPVRQTILIYPGTYAEAVTIGAGKDHIDLVGIDRDAVIIAPPADTDAITIKGTGARHNTIRNLTIVTDDDTTGEGRGIVIQDNASSPPTDIEISGVTIQIDGANSEAIVLEDRARRITINDVLILGAESDTITGVSIAGGSAADPSTEISLFDVTMLLDGCSAKGVSVDDEVSDLYMERLVIRKPAFGGRGVEANLATDLHMVGCDILARDGDGLIVGPGAVVRDSSIVVRKSYGSDAGCGVSGDDKPAIQIGTVSDIRIDNCYLEGRLTGINATSGASGLTVLHSDVRGGVKGLSISGSTDVTIINCSIAADSDLGQDTTLPIEQHYGLHILGSASNIAVAASTISARSTTARDAVGVYLEAAPTDGPATLTDCTITALVTSAATGLARGVRSDATSGVALVGGSVTAADEDERETDLYDLYTNSTAESRILVSGTQFSRWKGAMGAALGQEVEVLRVVDVPSAGVATVLPATALLGTERTITTGFTDVTVYRVLSVTGNEADMDQSVIIIGQDWAFRPIADSITLSGASTVDGTKAFRRVLKIVLPAQRDADETVSVGTAEILGLHAPISDDEDVLQAATKTSAGTSYVFESSTGVISVERGTVDISSLSPADDDSIEFTYRASK